MNGYKFGAFTDVTAEGSGKRLDLVVEQGGRLKAVEFKVAFNNKNLMGGYNGTGGVTKDIAKLREFTADEKYVAVFFVFYNKTMCKWLRNPKSFGRTSAGCRLQPQEGENFGDFSRQLAKTLARTLVRRPEDVVEVASDKERWLGFWCHRVR